MPEIVTSVAFCVTQASVVDPPLGIVLGVAVKELMTGAGFGCAETVTPTVAVAVPPGPVAVS
jgi:hypothetical protein